jgi:Uma2 family endonuclease
MALLQKKPFITPAEYLRRERESEFKHEYFAEEIFAMADGTPKHSLIQTNVCSELRSLLKEKPCRVYNSDLRVKVDATGLYTDPDASVTCGELQCDDKRSKTVLNPTVIVEVLSPSTEAYNRVRTFNHYRQIATLREYLLVWQDEPRIERFFKNAEGSWVLTEAAGMDGVLHVSTLGIDVSLHDVFDKVEFAPIEPPPKPPV